MDIAHNFSYVVGPCFMIGGVRGYVATMSRHGFVECFITGMAYAPSAKRILYAAQGFWVQGKEAGS